MGAGDDVGAVFEGCDVDTTAGGSARSEASSRSISVMRISSGSRTGGDDGDVEKELCNDVLETEPAVEELRRSKALSWLGVEVN